MFDKKSMFISKASKTDLRIIKESKKIKLCIHCKYYQNKYCNNFVKINLVDGQEEKVLAHDARYKTELCGPGGAYFRYGKFSNPPDLLSENQ